MLKPTVVAGSARLMHIAAERVFIALGSNTGNRAATLHRALNEVASYADVVDTSFLYESEAMYVKSQPAFYNAVAEIRTKLPPNELLHALKSTEEKLGRSNVSERFGPRNIDLDVLLYGNRHLDLNDTKYPLSVPHPRLAEREFVLQPLLDIAPTLNVPGVGLISELLHEKTKSRPPTVRRVTPLANGGHLAWGRRTLLMGIINVTPDSFSDGGKYVDAPRAVEQAYRFLKAGFDILDVGGQSSRPGAKQINGKTELTRVLPVIRALMKEFPEAILSIDTFRAATAKAALEEGAAIVNDVGAGSGCKDMLRILAHSRAPWIAMHLRGKPQDMMRLADYENVPFQVGDELAENIQFARSQGVRRWNIISDGGVGFTKAVEHNWALLQGWGDFKRQAGGYPTVLGLSRKSFLKASCSEGALAAERDWATAGAIACSMSTSAIDMVRVHEPSIADAVRAADIVLYGRS